MNFNFIFLFVALLLIVVVLAKLYHTYKHNSILSREGFQNSGNKFLFNSKFQYILLKKDDSNNETDESVNYISPDTTKVFIDIKNKDGTLFTLSTENNLTTTTENGETMINLGECLYYVSQIDKIIIQCEIDYDSIESQHASSITVETGVKMITSPFQTLSLLDCSKKELSVFEFRDNAKLESSDVISSSSGFKPDTLSSTDKSDKDYICYADSYEDVKNSIGYDVEKLKAHWENTGKKEGRVLCKESSSSNTPNDILKSKYKTISFVFYNATSYENESVLFSQLQNKFSTSKLVVMENFVFPQDFQQNNMLHDALNDPPHDNTQIPEAPDCASTPYGCCRDGKTISNDLLGKNCPPLPCSQSTFGCCRDGITPSLDINGFNCPKRQMKSE